MPDVRLPLGGALVTVEACPATNRQRLQAILEHFSMSDLMPEPTTPLSALGPAMTENYPAPSGKVRHTCFPYKNASLGKKIGRHDPGEHLSVDEKFCETVAIATLRMRYLPLKDGQKKPDAEWTGDISLDPWDGDREAAILAHMTHVMEYVPSGKLRETVTAIIERCGGRRLIEDQPLMWLTADAIPYFKQIKAQIEAASAQTDHHGKPVQPTRINVLSIVADEEMARAVIGMLMGVVDRETSRVESRLAQPALSVEQAGHDISKAITIKEELERYEELLKQPLDALKEKTDSLVISIANKTMEKAAMGI
jgi:hypothetical protein